MLHTVNKSPFDRNTFDTCLRLAKKGSVILFIEDGVYAAMQGTSVESKMKQAVEDHDVYVLGPDLKARGMDESKVVDGVHIVDYGDFVDLAVANGPVQAWL